MKLPEINPDYEHCKIAADFVKEKIGGTPVIGIVLGSGLGPLAERMEITAEIDYKDIPGFPRSTVASHAGKLLYGKVSGVSVICMQGRFHFYEGYSFASLSMSVRVLWLLGIKLLILTNAAGAINLSYKPGDIMLLSDHLNLLGYNPVTGQDYEAFGDRFYDVSHLYPESLRKIALKCAEESPLSVHEGVYMFFPGPNFETPAEVRAARILGADAVGMSTVPEALAAGHLKLPVLALSVMTNMAAGILNTPLSDDDVTRVANTLSADFSAYVEDIVRTIGETYGPDFTLSEKD